VKQRNTFQKAVGLKDLEYFADALNADCFASPIEAPDELLVPTVSLYEVFNPVAQQRGESEALQAIALMQQGTVIDLTSTLALNAARVSLKEKLPMADSIRLVTAQAYEATLWSQDSDFAHDTGVKYIATRQRRRR